VVKFFPPAVHRLSRYGARQASIRRHRSLRLLVGGLATAVVACGGSDVDLSPAAGAQHLGTAAGYTKVDHVSKPVLSAEAGPVAVEIGNLPASRIHFAAAREQTESGAPSTAARCSVRLDPDTPHSRELTSFDLPAGKPRWFETVVSSPAIENGKLLLACAASDGSPAAATWAQPLAVPQGESRPAPLIVLVSLDTLRADHVTGFPGARDLSPNLGRLADEGMRVVNATSEGAWTLASHYSLLDSRMYGFPVDEKPLVSLAQALADYGFVTAGLTGGGFMGAAFNYHLGFDHYAEYGTGTDDLPFVLADALPTIQRFEDAPTFLFLHTFAVHEYPPNEIAFHKKHGAFTPFRPKPREVASARRFYAKILRQADADLAPFFDALREISRSRPVLLVVVSDHGEAFAEHRNFRHGFDDHLVTLHDEVTHVPMIVWGPGLVPPGRSSLRPSMLLDVAPSILAAIGATPPTSMRGTNLWPIWSNNGAKDVPPTLGSVSHTKDAWSLRTERAKLIVEMTDRRGKIGAELYDLTNDPGERNDLAAARPDEVAAMRTQLRERLTELGVPVPVAPPVMPRCPHCSWQGREAFWSQALADEAVDGATAPSAVDEETLNRLRDLGYTD
jgi:arylsulfatase A-like enzyme